MKLVKPVAGIMAHLLGAVPRAISYLPLSFAVSLIRLHQNSGYDRYLETMVGSDVLSREADGVRDMVTWGGDLQVWTNARLSYWSDLLSVSLSPTCLMWVVSLSTTMALVHMMLNFVVRELSIASTDINISEGAAKSASGITDRSTSG